MRSRTRCVRAVVGLGLLLPAGGSVSAAQLLELYTRAREADPVFQEVLLRRDVSREFLRQSKAGVKPTISAGVVGSKTYQNIKQSENFLFTEGRSDFISDNFSISLTQPLYRSTALAELGGAREGVSRAEYELAAAEQELIFRLAQAHFTFLAARDALDLATAERTAILRQLQEGEQRLAAGLGTVGAVQEVRARLAVARASEIDSRNALEEARYGLAEITGKLPEDPGLLSDTFPLVEPERGDVDAWVEAAIFQNPAVKALEAAVRAADHQVRGQRGGRWPSIDLSMGFNSQDSGGTIFGGGNKILSSDVSVNVTVPIFDGGRTSAFYRQARLQRRIVDQQLERERRRVARETRTAFQGVVSGITRVEALRQSVFAQEVVLAQQEEGLRAGLTTALPVLDARRELFAARRELAEARYVYILNSLRLKRSTGILGAGDLREIDAYLQ